MHLSFRLKLLISIFLNVLFEIQNCFIMPPPYISGRANRVLPVRVCVCVFQNRVRTIT